MRPIWWIFEWACCCWINPKWRWRGTTRDTIRMWRKTGKPISQIWQHNLHKTGFPKTKTSPRSKYHGGGKAAAEDKFLGQQQRDVCYSLSLLCLSIHPHTYSSVTWGRRTKGEEAEQNADRGRARRLWHLMSNALNKYSELRKATIRGKERTTRRRRSRREKPSRRDHIAASAAHLCWVVVNGGVILRRR